MGLSVVQKEKFVPLGDLVLLREIDPSRTTKGGLALPDSVKPKQPRALVIAVGEGRMLMSGQRNQLMVKPGDIVLLNGPVHAVELEDQDRMMLCEYSQIAGIIKPA